MTADTLRRAEWPFTLPLVLLLGSVAPLAIAFASQHLGGLEPCELCIWQRWGYGAAILLGLLTLLLPRRIRAWGALLTSLALLAVAGISLFHVGVEQHWWRGLSACSSTIDFSQSVTDLEQQLMATPVIPCDRPAWTMLGISMAGYDFAYALGLGLFGFVAALRGSK